MMIIKAGYLCCLFSGILLLFSGCSTFADKSENQPSPFPAINKTKPPTPSPSPVVTEQTQVTEITSSPIDIVLVPASKEVLATAMEKFGHFLQELPLHDDIQGVPHKEYYGCTDSTNAGGMLIYSINTMTSENTKKILIDYFDLQRINHTDWKEFELTGYLGYAWEISASYHPNDDSDGQVLIYIGLLDHKLRATPEPLGVAPTENEAIFMSELHLWFNYIEKPWQYKGYLMTDLLRTCEDGYWHTIDP